MNMLSNASRIFYLKQTISLQFLFIGDGMLRLIIYGMISREFNHFDQHWTVNITTSKVKCFDRFVQKKKPNDHFWQGFFLLQFLAWCFCVPISIRHTHTNNKIWCDPTHGLIFAFFNYSSSFLAVWYWVMSMTT